MRAVILSLVFATLAAAEPADYYGIWQIEADGAPTKERIHIGPGEWAVGTRARGYRKVPVRWEDDRVLVGKKEQPCTLRFDGATLVFTRGGQELRLSPVVRLNDFLGAWRFSAAGLDWAEVLKDVPEIIHEEIRESTLKFTGSPKSRFEFSLEHLVIRRGENPPAKRAVVGWKLLDERTAEITLHKSRMQLRLADEGSGAELFMTSSKVRWQLVRADDTGAPLDLRGTWRFHKTGIDWQRVLAGVPEADRATVQANLAAAEDGATTLVVTRDAIQWDDATYPVAAWEQMGPAHLRAGFGGDYVDLFLADGTLYLRSPHEGAALPFARVAVEAAAENE